MKNIAIIPARSGSKGLKDKNIRDLCGKPLIAYSIEAATDSGMFDEIMVSTDSELYAEISKQYGASVPFLRSAGTATDTASSWEMVEEVLENYNTIGRAFDTFCLLQPTSPLRTSYDIKEAYELYQERADFAVVSVCEAEHSPLWCGQLKDDRELTRFINREDVKQRQECGTFYRVNGAIYIVDIKRFYKDKYLYQKGSFAYIMSQNKSVDIDTETDFKLAEFFIRGGVFLQLYRNTQRISKQAYIFYETYIFEEVCVA